MDLKNIKNLMDSEDTEGIHIPSNTKHLQKSLLPMQKIRKSMRGEIFTQLICIIIFFAAPVFYNMHELPKAVYLILMFITCLLTLGYLAKMTWFLRKTNRMDQQSKDSIVSYINDINITLEVYKTAIIAGSLLLPISSMAFTMGSTKIDESAFNSIFLLQVSNAKLAVFILGYLIIAVIIYYGTILWADKLYGVHIKELKKVLKEFDE